MSPKASAHPGNGSNKAGRQPEAQIVSSDKMVEDEVLQLKKRREQLDSYEKSDYVPGWFGVACSGGGIRSATFNLGILQALSHKGLLPYVDYLSTVSGGGYIGTWLHGVIKHRGGGNPRTARAYLEPPELKPHDEKNPDKDPVAFLRKYSSYLAPSLGLFSADFWVILVIWFRNMLLNQLMIIPSLGAITFLAFFFGTAFLAQGSAYPVVALLITLVALSAAVWIAGKGVRAVALKKSSWFDSKKAAGLCACALLAASAPVAFLNTSVAGIGSFGVAAGFIVLWFLFIVLQSVGGFRRCATRRHPEWSGIRIVLTLLLHTAIAAFATSGLIYLLCSWMTTWTAAADGGWRVIAWGPPLIAMGWLTGTAIHVGLIGANYEDFAREWLARVGAFLNMVSLAWTLLFTLAVFGPYWISLLALHFGKTAAGLGSGWIITTIVGVLTGKSDRTNGVEDNPRKVSPLEWVGKIAPTVFMAGILILVSFAAYCVLRAVVPDANPSLDWAAGAADGVPHSLQWLKRMTEDYWSVLGPHNGFRPIGVSLALFVLCALVAWGLQYSININEFSMHHFYKNRLVRCYMGASRGDLRKPSPATGFDPDDDFPIRKLLADPSLVEPQHCPSEKTYLGPYAIVNGTVNLNRGSELARQERQGESFLFTPLYCGFDPPHSDADRRLSSDPNVDLDAHGYRETCGYAYPDGLGIGTCMGISGAAANPNHGYHTSAPLAFLLTIFDVRLGWWLGNPRRRKGSNEPGPTQALLTLLSELFSQTDQRAPWMNISDGGHFENLGIYELVRRRCKYILCGDGEQDGDYSFGSLGGAIRKCRTDFGVSIEIDPRRIHPEKDQPSLVHCAVGTICYRKTDEHPAETGWLLYLKSSLTGDEPEDVAQYKASNADFPHQPTANQFFTESQFESYRKLGWHVAQTAFESVEVPSIEKLRASNSIDKIFRCLEQQWYPPSSAAAGVASRHNEAYAALMRRLGDETELGELGPQLFPSEGQARENDAARIYDTSKEPDRKIFLYCLDMIQLMENVWGDLHFDRASEREGPRHRGWMRIFAGWAKQPAIRGAWNLARDTFNPLFQQFFTTLENSEKERYELTSFSCGELPEKPDCQRPEDV
jgi:hypothetical protein